MHDSIATSFSLEAMASTSANYLENLVDGQGMPYFNVFATQPPSAAHDWPDHGDVLTRQFQAAVMLRLMTGRRLAVEDRWRTLLIGAIDPADGLFHRPSRPWCKTKVEDCALHLYALTTLAVADDDAEAARLARRMAEGYLAQVQTAKGNGDTSSFGGFSIKSLMVTARLLDCEPALEAAGILARQVVSNRVFTPDNRFGPKAHVHGNLRTLTGLADYALSVGDAALFSRCEALYRHTWSLGTRFGFIPEITNWRPSDLIACETCALMDLACLGLTLANHGHAEHWDGLERLMRNHLAESQVRDLSWLGEDDGRPDTDQYTWREVTRRSVGAWAGWSSPNHLLAYHETLNAVWGGPDLRDRIRVLQNCCGGSGVHALFALWRNAARVENGTLSVHLHLDKDLSEAEVRCQRPYRGRTTVTLRRDLAVRLRVPDFVDRAALRLAVNGAEVAIPRTVEVTGTFLSAQEKTRGPVELVGNYLHCGPRRAGDRVEINYPLPIASEEIGVGNPGHRTWNYRVTWKGDTVIAIEPLGDDVATCWSDFDKREVPVFYGHEGPGRIYQREHLRGDRPVESTPLVRDDGRLDLWRIASHRPANDG
jgi:hypothetical protein